MTDTTTAGEPIRLIDGNSTVLVQKLFTRTGERVELRAEALDEAVRLDAIALESVAWQDVATMADRGASVDRAEARQAPDSGSIETKREEPITISSEFARARLSAVERGGSARLAIEAPKLGYTIDLGARELEWLTLQDHETFSSWLEHPFGPEPGDDGH